MAKDKASFLLYCDLIHTVKKMPIEKAGELFLTILEYVNDENPVVEDIIIDLVFEPIKQQLKRDLKNYEKICERNSLNGSKGGRPKKEAKKPSGLSGNPKKPKKADTDTDTDTDTVNESDIKKEKVFVFRKSLIDLGIEDKIIDDWLKVRKAKKATNTETAFNAIKSQIEKSGLSANDCIKKAVEQSWSGFKSEWVGDNYNSSGQQTPPTLSAGKKPETFKGYN